MPEFRCLRSPVLLTCPHCSTPIPLSAARSDDLVICPACRGKSLAAPFDPYHRWLGIPPEQQPPDHYTLLGIDQFESAPEVIEAAADQRILYLRTHEAKHPRLTQQLLQEVIKARICLLNNTQRAAYDGQFLMPAPPPVSTKAIVSVQSIMSQGIKRQATKRNRTIYLVSGGFALLFLAIFFGWWLRSPAAKAFLPAGNPEHEAIYEAVRNTVESGRATGQFVRAISRGEIGPDAKPLPSLPPVNIKIESIDIRDVEIFGKTLPDSLAIVTFSMDGTRRIMTLVRRPDGTWKYLRIDVPRGR